MSDLRLTAILKTDLRGSTPLFRSFTEDQLREFLNEQKSLISKLVVQHHGQIIKGEGDAFWTIFPSVTIATQTAIQIQQELLARQAGIIEENRTALRIVITAGDVLHHAHDIFGYGVNLTSRIETITPANEIYLSQAAWLVLNQAEIATALVGEFSFKGVEQPEKVYKVLQSQRTVILPDQVIITTDLRNFTVYQQAVSIHEVENLLLNLEKTVRAASEENGGAMRVALGDMFTFTFSEAGAALTAVTRLCQHWDTFIEANHIPCPLAIGMHYGQLAIFRWFAYGEDINIAVGLTGLVKAIGQDEAHSSVLLSSKISQMALGTEWEKQLLPVAWDKIAGKLPRTDYAVCELLPVHSQTLPASGV